MTTVAAALAALIAFCFLPKEPQIGADEEAFKTVDALFTAVTSRSPPLLEQCDQRLRKLHTDGKLSDPAFRSLEKIMARARDGKWQPAAEDLYAFMRGQRR